MKVAPPIALSATLCAVCVAFLNTPRISARSRFNPDFSSKAVAFDWREATPADSFDHHGIIIFCEANGRIYSRAWPLKSRNQWPTVWGVGVQKDREIHIVYRSASASPGHEFYHCDCHFILSPDARRFTCNAMQKASAADAAMVPTFATGMRLDTFDPAWRTQLEHVLDAARGSPNFSAQEGEPLTAPAERCPVLGNVASYRIGATYKGKSCHFCCESCRNVFNGHPEAFTQNAK